MEHNIKNNKMGNGNILVSGDVNHNVNINNSFIIERVHEFINNYRPSRIIKNMEKLKNSFIETSQYKNAISSLENTNAVLLKGCSGIGKTDTSIMIANYFIEKYGFNFRFVSSPKENDLQNITAFIDENIDEKEIIIFNDFLGNVEINNSQNYFSELEEFLKRIEEYDNKKFIFNSRKTILEIAKVHSKKIEILLNLNFELVDLESWKNIEDKVSIFKLYCLKANIFDKVLVLINEKKWNNNTLKNIFEHKNFTPFIIKMATKECCKMEASEYKNIFLNYLDHPEYIWEKEINALDDASREYIYILYSLSDSFVQRNIVDKCYENYIKQLKKFPDSSLQDIHKRIETLIYNEDNKVEFIHPSILDYLKNKITLMDKENIIRTAVYLEQIITLDIEQIKDLIILKKDSKLPQFFNFKVLPMMYNFKDGELIFLENNILIQYLKYIYEFKIEDKNNEAIVIAAMERILECGASLFFQCSYNVLNVLKLNYDFSEILSNYEFVKTMYEYANLTNIWRLMELTITKDENGFNFEKIDSFIQDKIENVLMDIGTNVIDSWIEDNIENYIEDAFESYDKDDEYDYWDITQELLDTMLEDLDNDLAKDEIVNTVKKHNIHNVDIEKFDDFEPSDYIYDIIESAVIEFDNNRQ